MIPPCSPTRPSNPPPAVPGSPSADLSQRLAQTVLRTPERTPVKRQREVAVSPFATPDRQSVGPRPALATVLFTPESQKADPMERPGTASKCTLVFGAVTPPRPATHAAHDPALLKSPNPSHSPHDLETMQECAQNFEKTNLDRQLKKAQRQLEQLQKQGASSDKIDEASREITRCEEALCRFPKQRKLFGQPAKELPKVARKDVHTLDPDCRQHVEAIRSGAIPPDPNGSYRLPDGTVYEVHAADPRFPPALFPAHGGRCVTLPGDTAAQVARHCLEHKEPIDKFLGEYVLPKKR